MPPALFATTTKRFQGSRQHHREGNQFASLVMAVHEPEEIVVEFPPKLIAVVDDAATILCVCLGSANRFHTATTAGLVKDFLGGLKAAHDTLIIVHGGNAGTGTAGTVSGWCESNAVPCYALLPDPSDPMPVLSAKDYPEHTKLVRVARTYEGRMKALALLSAKANKVFVFEGAAGTKKQVQMCVAAGCDVLESVNSEYLFGLFVGDDEKAFLKKHFCEAGGKE